VREGVAMADPAAVKCVLWHWTHNLLNHDIHRNSVMTCS
jgi:hypothetical protein